MCNDAQKGSWSHDDWAGGIRHSSEAEISAGALESMAPLLCCLHVVRYCAAGLFIFLIGGLLIAIGTRLLIRGELATHGRNAAPHLKATHTHTQPKMAFTHGCNATPGLEVTHTHTQQSRCFLL